MAKFKRQHGNAKNTKDSSGAVQIKVLRVEGGFYVKGNICKTFTVQNAKVSEVAKAIEEVLFA